MNIADAEPHERVRVADYMARCWVQGAKKYTLNDKTTTRVDPIVGSFHDRLLPHPLVREAVTQGWDRDLRAHLVRVARTLILQGIHPQAFVVDKMMPDQGWIASAKVQAARNKSAEAWRAEVIEKHGSVDAYLSKTNGGRTTTFKRPAPDRNFWNARYGRQE